MTVSVIVTAYNYARYIAHCLDSLLAQRCSLGDFEIVVVDDASTDDTQARLHPYLQHERIHALKSPHNVGVAASANRGLKASKGKYVVRVDADDYVSPDFLGGLVSCLEANPTSVCVASDYSLVDNEGQILKVVSAKARPISCGILYRRSFMVQVGGYNEHFRHREEDELRHRLGSIYRVSYSNSPSYFYRVHGSNKSLDESEMEVAREHIALQTGSYMNPQTPLKEAAIGLASPGESIAHVGGAE